MGKALFVAACCSIAVMLIGPASAGTLATDPASILGWQGTRSFSASAATVVLSADVDYAVYAPGDFSGSAALGNPADPSGGLHYVYAYQAFNNVEGGNRPVSQFSVGFLDLAPEGDGNDDAEFPENIGFVDGFSSPDLDPVSSFSPDSNPQTIKEAAGWGFQNGGLQPAGDNSDILIYTSPFGPEWDRASILGGGLSNFQPLPSPVPEPTTFVLSLFAMTSLLVYLRHLKN
jgi:hypothetical protein